MSGTRLADIPLPPANPEEIMVDTVCTRCEYNLRGLTWEGRCPECGQPTALSRVAFSLSSTDPAWVGRLRCGVWWCLMGFCSSIVLWFLPMMGPFGQGTSSILNAVGGILLSSRNRDPRLESPAPFLRFVLRTCAFVDLTLLLLIASALSTGVGGGSPFMVMLISWGVGYVARCLYLYFLLPHVNQRRFREQMGWQIITITLGLPISMVVGFFALIAGMGGLFFGGGGGSPGGAIIALVCAILALIGAVGYVSILIRFSRVLREAEQNSRRVMADPANWVADPATGALVPPSAGSRPVIFWPLAALTFAFAMQLFYSAWSVVTFRSLPLAEPLGLLSQIAFWIGAVSLAVQAPTLTNNKISEVWRIVIFGGLLAAIVYYAMPHVRSIGVSTFTTIETVVFLLYAGSVLGIWVTLNKWARSRNNERLITGSRLVIVGLVLVFLLAFGAGWLADVSPGATLRGFGRGVSGRGIPDVLTWLAGVIAAWTYIAIKVGMVVLLIPVLISQSQPIDSQSGLPPHSLTP